MGSEVLKMDMSFIEEMIEDIASKKKAMDNVAFLKFLKEELDRKGINLTVNCQKAPFVSDNVITSDIIGVELDLSDHDKDKDAEIEKYKKSFEFAKCEKDKTVCEYQNEVDRLKNRVQELEESQENLPIEPIKIAEYLMDRTVEVKNTFPMLQGGEASIVPVHDVSELRQIAEHLLVYCNHAEVE